MGHVGSTSDGYGEVHGGWGYGGRNRGRSNFNGSNGTRLGGAEYNVQEEEKHLIIYD